MRAPLTPREVEVMRLVAQGFTDHEIADKLGISPHTARTHVANSLRALGARTRAQAVADAIGKGLLG